VGHVDYCTRDWVGDSMFVKEMPTLAILVQLDIDAVETDLDVVVTYRTGDEVFAVTEVYILQFYCKGWGVKK
jgi:hypothetical protein|tara:strand:- start:178 stop:393 length:216 start_codon:yes stop_codon:yes gene_type:complete